MVLKDGKYKPESGIEEVFKEYFQQEERPLVVCCGSGVHSMYCVYGQ